MYMSCFIYLKGVFILGCVIKMENNKKFKALFIMSFLFCSVCGNIFTNTVSPNEDITIEPSINKFDIESSNEENVWRLKYQNIDFSDKSKRSTTTCTKLSDGCQGLPG